MNIRDITAQDRAAAQSVAAWVSSKTPDELGTLADSIWSLGQAASGWRPELLEHARALMEHDLNGEADPRDPRPLVSLAELLERAAGTLRSASLILEHDGGRREARAS